jgi:hypothetical protein
LDILQIYKLMKRQLASEIAQVDWVALTNDLHTSSNQTPFMVVSVQYIKSN